MKKKHLNKKYIHKDELEEMQAKDFIIDALDKQNTQNILSIKLLTQILMYMHTLESNILIDDNVVAMAIKCAITAFKLELVEGLRQIEYDGSRGYNIVPRCDDNNDDNDEYQ